MKKQTKESLAVLALNILAIPAVSACSKNGFYEFAGIIAVAVIYFDISFFNNVGEKNNAL